ncbi:hypothetical protein TrRE_jg12781 [Triparma retinervis]|uniref:Sulfotransferase n=1 Tax=Triparma retinervis TaxID=2557542 RepID=A0A9W7AJP0_9STRA|nr:hypothetical protein TrRE_jg12781 [Triparma retinervis]
MGLLSSIASGDLPLSVFLNTIHLLLIILNPLISNEEDSSDTSAPSFSGYFFGHIFPLFGDAFSITFFTSHLIINICGFVYLYSFYKHAVTNIFNKEVPNLFTDNFFLSVYNIFLLVRPLEIMWRRATSSFRCLPDVLVIGEVRCGTTTICSHIASLPGCHPPFCPWKHPELDKKETFYFAGHYNDMRPSMYRMCFPLKSTRWFHTKVLRRPFFTFDGCAQYLTSPTAPYFIAASYSEPVSQALSWWRYERAAMSWGAGMGLTRDNVRLRTRGYFGGGVGEAVRFSMSKLTEAAYLSAEGCVEGKTAEERRYVKVVTLGDIADGPSLRSILKHVTRSIGVYNQRTLAAADLHIDFHVDKTVGRGGLRRNRGGEGDPNLEPTEEEVRMLKEHFVGERERLEKVTKQVIRW